MKTLTIVVTIGLVAWNAMGQRAHAQKGMGDPTGMARQGVAPEIVTLSGILVEVKSGPCKSSTGKSDSGTHLLLRTEDKTVHEIHLGPERDVESVVKKLVVGQAITIAGFRTDKLPENTLVAQSLTTDDETITVRGEDLRPVWAGGPGSRQGRGKGMRGGQNRQVAGPGTAGRGNAGRCGQGNGACRGKGGPGRGQVAFANATQTCTGKGCRSGNRQGQGGGRGRQQGQSRGFRGGRGPGSGPGPASTSASATRSSCAVQLASQLDTTPITTLTPAEREGLLLMREEEKLAHDVYTTLGEKWSLRPFANIPQAESRHMNAVRMLLERHEIEDPIGDMDVGVFRSTRMQELYDQLVARGRGSIEEAIRVGIFIEELDIADLQRLIGESRSDDVKFVYQNLLRASHNHLRAFQRQSARFDVSDTVR